MLNRWLRRIRGHCPESIHIGVDDTVSGVQQWSCLCRLNFSRGFLTSWILAQSSKSASKSSSWSLFSDHQSPCSLPQNAKKTSYYKIIELPVKIYPIKWTDKIGDKLNLVVCCLPPKLKIRCANTLSSMCYNIKPLDRKCCLGQRSHRPPSFLQHGFSSSNIRRKAAAWKMKVRYVEEEGGRKAPPWEICQTASKAMLQPTH